MTASPSRSKPRSRWSARWALMPIGLLTSSVLGVGWMAAVAVRDPNFALEHDYYQKALHWDQTQTQAADNQRLAFQFSAPTKILLNQHGLGTFEVRINDRNGRPVAGARVVADAFANAYSDDITQLTLSERAPGVYAAAVKAGHPGLWEFRVSMDANGGHATATSRCDLVLGGAA